MRVLAQYIFPALLAFVGLPRLALASEVADAAANIGQALPLASVLPFVLMLGAIAVLPLAAPHWWEHNRNRAIVALLLSVPLAIYLVTSFGHEGVEKLEHAGMEYLSFVLLLGSLFVISGGIYVQGSLSGTPLVNTGMIGLGGLLASFIGTTGASMVLIRPLLCANASRQKQGPRCRVLHLRRFELRRAAYAAWATRRCFWASSEACPSSGRFSFGRSGYWSTGSCW